MFSMTDKILNAIQRLKDSRTQVDSDLDASLAMANKIEDLMKEHCPDDHDLWSKFLYEKAYIHYLRKEVDDAKGLFEKSVYHAESAGNIITAIYSRYVSISILYFAELFPAETAYSEIRDLYYSLETNDNIKDEEKERKKSLEYNILWKLLHIGFDIKNPQYAQWAKKFLRCDFIRQKRVEGNGGEMRYCLEAYGLIAISEHEYSRAAAIFSFLLDIELQKTFEFPNDLDDIKEIAESFFPQNIKNYSDGICRKHLALAHALRHSSAQNKDELIEMVLKDSLKYKDGLGNDLYISKIKEQLENEAVTA